MGQLSQSIRYFVVLSLMIFSVQFWLAPAYGEESFSKGLEAAKRDFYKGDLDQALVKFQALQAGAEPEVDYFIALIHRREGRYRDFGLALSLLQQASSKDYPPAMRELGMTYERGEGVGADLLTALDWYRKADALERPDSGSIQFFKSQDGILVEQNINQQMQRLKEVAVKGDLDAAFQLAKLYDEGALVALNPEQAVHWYRIAAEAGHGYSRLMLGYFLCRGIGISKNVIEADHWLKLLLFPKFNRTNSPISTFLLSYRCPSLMMVIR
jgi:TPR repeat protein